MSYCKFEQALSTFSKCHVRAGAVSHSAKLVAGLRAMECEEGEAALFSDPLAGILAGDSVLHECRDYAMVSETCRQSLTHAVVAKLL